jgi:hypothetical protein
LPQQFLHGLAVFTIRSEQRRHSSPEGVPANAPAGQGPGSCSGAPDEGNDGRQWIGHPMGFLCFGNCGSAQPFVKTANQKTSTSFMIADKIKAADSLT